jgi:hypothetical protein
MSLYQSKHEREPYLLLDTIPVVQASRSQLPERFGIPLDLIYAFAFQLLCYGIVRGTSVSLACALEDTEILLGPC